jgi:hypothetical protein
VAHENLRRAVAERIAHLGPLLQSDYRTCRAIADAATKLVNHARAGTVKWRCAALALARKGKRYHDGLVPFNTHMLGKHLTFVTRQASVDEEGVHRMRFRQSLGVSPVSFLNAAAKAVWEE